MSNKVDSAPSVQLEENAGLGRERSGSTLSVVFKPDPNEEAPRDRAGSVFDAKRIRNLEEKYPNHKEDPPLKYHPIYTFSFIIKLIQVVITIVCAGLYTRAIKLIRDNITSQQFPSVVFSAYMIITPVIILSYVLGQKMPELLIRVFHIMGAILFFVTSLLALVTWVANRDYWNSEPDEGDVDHDPQSRNLAKMLIAEGFLSFLNSCLYLADVVYSLRRTLAYL